jgi:hypothetical protein
MKSLNEFSYISMSVAVQYCDVVISRRVTWGKKKSKQNGKEYESRRREKKRNRRTSNRHTAHVIGCFMSRTNNLYLRNIFIT